MCRHLAYLGPPVTLRTALIDPPLGLYRQSWAPRLQAHGTVNADGFGVGWYADGDPVPARYRRAVPIWGDTSLPDLARVIRSGAVLAAVRSATSGTATGEQAAAPFGADHWLFSHNGVLEGWRDLAERGTVQGCGSSIFSLESLVDSAYLWALVLARLRAGDPQDAALAGVIAAVEAAGGSGRFNFLLTDGRSIAATACGDTLWYLVRDGGVTVASEPCDDDRDWIEVPDRHLLSATPSSVSLRPLAGAPAADARRGTASTRLSTDVRTEGTTPMTTIEHRLPPDYRAKTLRADALAGLTSTPKSLPPKWFYDAEGSALFEKITELPEYYPTRSERSILRAVAPRIAALSEATVLVELGSGSSEKTRLLLDALRDAGTLRAYVPVDVSESALMLAGDALSLEYPGLAVHAVLSDFEEQLGLPSGADAEDGPRLVAFLGSTIGNMVPAERAAFLRRVRSRLRPGDSFLLGTDLVKDPAVLEAAYDDAAGVTAAFNKNVLAVLNAELGADFDLDAFEHVARWDAANEWIEMRLRSASEQQALVRDLDLVVRFAAGEEMRTEVSAKFRQAGVEAELAAAGLALRSWWTDAGGQFGLSLSSPDPGNR
jgi:dimethylhistidine N-methyltransferase/ergothioneine biosynthesis protein EgtC